MKISVTKEGILRIDEKVIEVSSLDAKLLEEIMSEALESKVDFSEVESGTPLAEFFMSIQTETEEGSEFRKEIDKYKSDIKISKEAKEKLEHVQES